MRSIDQSNSNSELSKDDDENLGNQSPKQPDKKRRSEIDSNRIEETINEAEAEAVENMAQNNGDAIYPPVGLEVEKAAINKSSIKVITKIGDKESSSKMKPNRNEQNQIDKTNSLLNVSTGLSDQSEFSKNLIIASASSDEVNRDNICNKNGNDKENLAEEEVNSEKEEGILLYI